MGDNRSMTSPAPSASSASAPQPVQTPGPGTAARRRPPHELLGLTSPAYGGDYNPEQWDEATFAEDLELMAEADVNMVSLGIFSWARLEPREGDYELDWLVEVIDRLHDAGIAVDLATATASPPAWMAAEHPESLPMSADGVRLGFGSRQQYCPSSAVYRERSAALAQALAERLGDHPGVVMWHIGNEYGCHTAECFCPACAQAFRSWLAHRYGDVEHLNAAWGTDFWSQRYTSLEQVGPPAAMPTFHNPAQLLDWRRFSDHQLRSLMEAEARILREHSSRPITTNFMGDFPATDYWRWAGALDIISDDSYPDPADEAAAHEVAWAGDLMRGLAGGHPWILMEQAPSAVQWRGRNSPKRPGQLLLWSLARVAHGADGILQFQWRQSRQGAETFHSGMVPHAGRASRTWEEVVATGRALKRLGPVLGEPVRAQVAVVLDWDSQWAMSSAIGPVEPGERFETARAWHRSLWEAGIATDVVPAAADPGAELTGYRLIIVPAVFIDYPELAGRLEQAAAAGAQVVVVGPTGVVDANAGAVLGGYLGSLRPLLGVRVTDHAALSGPVGRTDSRAALVNRLSRVVEAPAAETWTGLEAVSVPLRRVLDQMGSPAPDLRAGGWAEEVRVDEAPDDADTDEGREPVEVVAVFDGRGGGADLAGWPAITRRPAGGAGAAWYVAADLDAVSRAALLRLVCAHARVRPVVADLPDGVEAQRRGQVLFLLNHGDRAAEVTGVVGTDLLSGEACTGHVVLAPRSALVVLDNTRPASV
ncbi:Beta-galactosidase bgaB [Actinomyces viscosus]|uniref:beta-galactosidase n=2 Tax=Actinomyces viscosus TaxID=1656 RepID=A0A3S4Z8R5_ACTVI|nr:Beta-galactosidase bgaB [Actinomyces viscosus]